MAKISIIGAGQAGLLLAHALHRQGHAVTVHSDRTPEDFLRRARPTGTAGRFPAALDFERELGLERWGDKAPPIEAVHLTFCPRPGNRLLTLLGRLSRPGLAIDVRLQSATWLADLVQRGGGVEIESVGVPRLEEITAASDLTVVAAGRAELTRLFPRDEARSRYREPQRRLAMVNVVGPAHRFAAAPWLRPVKFNLFAGLGECFWVPWYSKDGHQAWSLLFEGRAGGAIDRFAGLRSAEAILAQAREVMRALVPWDHEWLQRAEPCDENAWQVGAVLPEVREVVGRLPSGRLVMALGDTAQSLDPVGGQGANNGNKMARNLAQCVAARPEGPFDAAWMRATQDAFWAAHGAIDRFNNTLLEPLTPAGKLIFMAQYGSTGRRDDDSPQQRLADAVFENFNDPNLMTAAFHDVACARALVAETCGSGLPLAARGAARVALAQLRQALGRPPRHPGT